MARLLGTFINQQLVEKINGKYMLLKIIFPGDNYITIHEMCSTRFLSFVYLIIEFISIPFYGHKSVRNHYQ